MVNTIISYLDNWSTWARFTNGNMGQFNYDGQTLPYKLTTDKIWALHRIFKMPLTLELKLPACQTDIIKAFTSESCNRKPLDIEPIR